MDPPTASDCPSEGHKLDKPYRELLGSLSHIARCSRPDILYATFYLARYQANPGQAHWTALKRILRYLKGTKHIPLTFRRGSGKMELNVRGDITTKKSILQAFSDSDWGGCKDTRKSTTGYVLTLNDAPILCRSSKQKSTATSVCESETISLTDCVKDVLWAKNLLQDLLQIKPAKVKVWCDNQSTVDIANSDKGSDRCKHIAIKHGFLQDQKEETINISKIPTKDNIADIFTKPLPGPLFSKLRDRLFGIIPNPYSIYHQALLTVHY